jgi:hypothetical protein
LRTKNKVIIFAPGVLFVSLLFPIATNEFAYEPGALETIVLNQIKSYRGLEFQEFGDRLLAKIYPGEYTAVRAGGPWGDLKNDGYCYVNRTFFHFYGTSQYNVSALKTKITADVEGCLKNQQQVKRIVYVSNDSALGVIEAHIDALRLQHGIPIETWGPGRLTEMMCRLSVQDIGSILKMPLSDMGGTSEPTDIVYTAEENSIKIYPAKHVKVRMYIAFTALIAFIVTIFLYKPLPFGWYLLILFILYIVSSKLSWYGTMAVDTASGKEYRRGIDFYVKEEENYKRFRKKALCSYPKCKGVVYLAIPPEEEKKQYKLLGYCSSNRTDHTFSYNEDNTGTPITSGFAIEAENIKIQIHKM